MLISFYSLAEYNAENPRIIAKCQHHFHLSCIFEWKERSDTCPICDQVCIENPPSILWFKFTIISKIVNITGIEGDLDLTY